MIKLHSILSYNVAAKECFSLTFFVNLQTDELNFYLRTAFIIKIIKIEIS
jgi:hypothetical protein